MITCPKCATENRDQAKFCDECGFPLAGIAAGTASEISSAQTAQLVVIEDDQADDAISEEPIEEEAAIEEEPVDQVEEAEVSEDATGEVLEEALDEIEFAPVDPTVPFTEISDEDEDALEREDEQLEEAIEAEEAAEEEAVEEAEADDEDIETDYDLYAPGATRIDLSGIDENVYDDLTGYIPEIKLEADSRVRDGSTMQFAPIEDEAPAKSKNYKASAKTKTSLSINPQTRNRVLIAAAALIVVASIAFITYQMELWGGKSVPNVVGLTEAEATSVLNDEGFKVRSTQVKSDDTEGLVLVMDPSSGSRVGADEEVVIHIATARSIPDVIGKTEAQAIVAFTDEGYENVTYEKEYSSKPEGTVISIEPEVGTRAKSSAAITVKIAQPFIVPDVSNMYLDDAQAAIEEVGLVPAVRIVNTQDFPDGSIIGTDPAVGTKVEEGSTVYIEIARARGAELEALVPGILYEGATVTVGMQGYQVESLESYHYEGDDKVSFTMYAKPFISAFGETAFFSTQVVNGTIEFDEDNNVVNIS